MGAPNRESKTVFCTDASKGAKCGRESHLSFSECVSISIEVRHELALLNTHYGFEIQALHNRNEIQVMDLTELSRTQTMIAIVSSPVMLCAQGYS